MKSENSSVLSDGDRKGRTKDLMRRSFIKGVGASVAALSLSQVTALFLSSKAAAAAISDAIRLDDVSWDQLSQVFVVKISAHQQIVDNSSFFEMRVRLRMTTVSEFRGKRTPVGTAGPVTNPISIAPGAAADSEGFVQIIPASVPWDRNGGTFSGTATVQASAELVANDGTLTKSLNITAPPI